ncbi:MAG: TonB-dependent receptor, partial [Pseudomonadota bacterium]
PEIVTSYEAGFRTDFFDGTVRFNPTVFLSRYKDAQRQIAATLTNSQGVEFQETRFFNAAELDVYGVELEAQWSTPIEGVTLGGNFSWQDGVFDSFEADTDFDGDIDVDFSGRPLTRTPEFTYTIYGRYEQPIANNMVFRGGLTVNYEDAQVFAYSDLGSEFDTTLNARTLMTATAEIADEDNRWFMRLYGRNLLDKRYRVSSQPVAALWIFSQYGEPRAYGIEVGARY